MQFIGIIIEQGNYGATILAGDRDHQWLLSPKTIVLYLVLQ
jgi:hypothetical protein